MKRMLIIALFSVLAFSSFSSPSEAQRERQCGRIRCATGFWCKRGRCVPLAQNKPTKKECEDSALSPSGWSAQYKTLCNKLYGTVYN
jgi:hypothetical protein